MKGRYAIMGSTKRNFLFAGALALALSGGLLSGCTQTTEAPSATASVSAETAPPAVSAPPGPGPAASGSTGTMAAGGTNNPGAMPPGPASAGGVPPMAGAGAGGAPFTGGAMGGDPNAPISPSPDLDKKIAAAEKGGDKKAIGVAYTERGAARLYDEKAGARTKYRAALEDFRKALAADPTNKNAKASKDTIESIYKEMGRPIPK